MCNLRLERLHLCKLTLERLHFWKLIGFRGSLCPN